MFPTNVTTVPSTPTLYEWAGGADALYGMIDAFYDRVEQDELLSPSFLVGFTKTTVAMWPSGGVRSSAVLLSTPRSSADMSGC